LDNVTFQADGSPGMNSDFPRSSRGFSATVVVAFLAAWLAGCADEVKGTFQTKLPAEKVLEFAGQAMTGIGFSVKVSDSKGRMVVGEKNAMARWSGPALTQLKVAVNSTDSGSRVDVALIPPSGAYGSAQIPFKDYVYALRLLVPDLAKESYR
jgi:hypothetical protein